MAYGYDSKLQSKGIQQIIDYKRDFLGELKKARRAEDQRDRPVIFLGHSFGGIIIAQSLLEAKTRDYDPVVHSISRSTHAVMFFATPHRGLIADDILKVLNPKTDADRIRLVRSIDANSEALTEELRRFINGFREIKIVSFYEQQKTKRLVQDENGMIKRSGEFYTMLQNESALLQLPDSMEEKHPVNADHSDIVKFDTRANDTYGHVSSYLRCYLEHFKSQNDAAEAAFVPQKRGQLDEKLFDAARSGDVQKLRTLLSTGASITATDSRGQTALHLAASGGYTDAVTFLIRTGASKDARDSADCVPAKSARMMGHNGLANRMERNLLR